MEMIAPQFVGARNRRQRFLGKKPLPDEILGRAGIFLFEGMVEKHPGIPCGKVLIMQIAHHFELIFQIRHEGLGNGHGPVLVTLAMHRENTVLEVEMLNPQFDAFEKTKAAAIQQLDHDVERIFEILDDRVYFRSGQDHGDISRFFGARYIPLVAEILFKNMSEKKQQGVECLVLSRGGDTAFHGQKGEVFLYISRGKLAGMFIMQKALELAHPIRIGLKSLTGIMPRLDLCGELVDGLVPGRGFGLF